MSAYLLGLDIGTTATKGVIGRDDGTIVAEASAENTLLSPQPGWAEEDANRWWESVGEVCRELFARHPEITIDAVGVSGMVPTIVLLDADNRLLRHSIQQNDARAVEEIAFFHSRTDNSDILSRTGSAVTSQSIGPKLLWLKKHEPEVIRRARRLMGSYDYINFKLTGIPVIESNWALESGLYDLKTADWAADLIALSGIDQSLLGSVHAATDVIGSVTLEAAQQTGIKVGTPVVAGSADHVASAFSAGLKKPGDLLIKLGGAGDILMALDAFKPDDRLFIDYHVIPNQYLINGCMATSGSIIKWFREQFAPEATYEQLDAEAAPLPAGAEGLILLPYFLGEKTPIFDPLARGVLFGLTLRHTRAHVFRAVLEAISFGFYHHIQVLGEIGYTPNDPVYVTNGGAHSTLWRQITADVLGLPLHLIAQHQGSSLGALFVAGKGIGLFNTWTDIDRFIRVETVTKPAMERHAAYKDLFVRYRALYKANKPLFEGY